VAQEQLQKAKALVQAKRYDEARKLLSQIDHPTAKKWLEDLNLKMFEDVLESDSGIQAKSIETVRKAQSAYEVIVTTGDLQIPYDVISPVYFQTSNKGLFSSSLGQLKKKYQEEIKELRAKNLMNQKGFDLGIIWYGEFSLGQNDFESAFFVSTRELQNRAWQLKADAIVAMRQDIDIDTTGFQFFYLQMYGTAVRFK
jgi:uncharacterized protein YbjQ (UPF0145 family)